MRSIKPVRISKIGFDFCRYGVAGIVWLAVIFNQPVWLLVSATILGLSAVLKIRKAPMVVIGEALLGNFLKEVTVIDENGIRFAHTMGFVLNILVIGIVWSVPTIGLWVMLAFAAMKTVSAAGHCSALKLYDCLNNDTCCKGVKKYV